MLAAEPGDERLAGAVGAAPALAPGRRGAGRQRLPRRGARISRSLRPRGRVTGVKSLLALSSNLSCM